MADALRHAGAGPVGRAAQAHVPNGMEVPGSYVDIGQSRDELQRQLVRLRTEIRDLRSKDAEKDETIWSLRAVLEQASAEGAPAPPVPPAE